MHPIFRSAAIAATLAIPATAADSYTNLIRQEQQGGAVVWQMPVDQTGTAPAPLPVPEGGSLFQLWAINQTTNQDYLLDQKLVGAFLPKGTITIRTQDSYNGIPRIRVDQPFSVDFNVSNLIFGPNLPPAASRVLVEHHLAPNLGGTAVITAAQAIAGSPHSSGYLEKNGVTTVDYAAASIQAPDPRKARGEEHFVMHALADETYSQTQLATAFLQVWPMATGSISGITEGSEIRGKPPALTMRVDGLYPRSDTYLQIYSTGTELGEEGKKMPGSVVILDQEFPADRLLVVSDYGSLFDSDGPYRIDLLTTTPFGTERLSSVSFTVNRTLRINAMQVDAETN